MSRRLADLTAASAATAGGERVGVILGLTPAWPEARVAGEAFPVSGRAGDNLVLHEALAVAPAGSVLVASLKGASAAGHWGELMCVAAARAGIAGVVIAGTVRDVGRISARRYPVFHRGVGPRPAAKSYRGALGVPIEIDAIQIEPGDVVVADVDGVVVIPSAAVDQVVGEVIRLEEHETKALRAIAQGASTLDALGLRP